MEGRDSKQEKNGWRDSGQHARASDDDLARRLSHTLLAPQVSAAPAAGSSAGTSACRAPGR